MGLEEHAQTFKEIDKYGLFSEEDRNYLVERGILKPRKAKQDLCCPNCSAPLPEEFIKKITDLLLLAIQKDSEKYAKKICSNGSIKAVEETDSIMFS
jgi:hypothetical protein